MGKPNFQRLAELGQLPDYVKPNFNEALAQINAERKDKKEKKEEIKKAIKKEKETKEVKKEKKVEKDEFVDDLLN